MSVLVVNATSEGIIFGADRLSRWGPDPNGNVGFAEGFKILRWPNRRAMVGFVGMADLGRRSERNSTFEWLTDFIGENHDFDTVAALANNLTSQVQRQFNQDGWQGEPDDVFVLELAGYERSSDGTVLPTIWHIANTHGIENGSYTNIDSNFGASEELISKYSVADRENMRTVLRNRPHWIHQTGDFGMFNSLCLNLDSFFDWRLGSFGLDALADPSEFDRLVEFENRVRMKVLAYGAFNDSFETPISREVGGGADILTLEWPE